MIRTKMRHLKLIRLIMIRFRSRHGMAFAYKQDSCQSSIGTYYSGTYYNGIRCNGRASAVNCHLIRIPIMIRVCCVCNYNANYMSYNRTYITYTIVYNTLYTSITTCNYYTIINICNIYANRL